MIELPNDVPSVLPANPLTPQPSAGRKRRRESSAATHDSLPPSPPPQAAESDNTAASQSAGRSRGHKSAASKAADAKAAERDGSIKQQLLDNPDLPISLAQACTVYQLHLPPCAPLTPPQPQSQAPKACKPAGHPNCLHTLGYKRKGIWSSHPPHIALLGSDPAASHRPANWYAGLKNQGATCYLNILVQSLYMNTHFRESLTRFDSCRADVRRQWEQAVTQRTAHIPTVDPSKSLAASSESSSSTLNDHLPYHLLSIFTRLSLSRRSFIDPVALVRACGVTDVDQQDAHEFRTYILQILEHALLHSTYKPHHTLLQTLFEGNSKSVLRCQQCGHESTTASPFIDLTLPIKGRGSVYASMHSLCDVEQLEENAVYCSTCKAKTSMDKRLEYDSLPPYLNMQLMRFELVFAGNGVRKKKIGDKIYIPEKIRMEDCLLKPVAVEAEVAVKGEEQMKVEAEKEENAVKLQVESVGEQLNGAGRKRGGRRKAGVKNELSECVQDRMEPVMAIKAKAEAVLEEERMVDDESAVKEEKAAHNAPAMVKQKRSRGPGRGKAGQQLNGAPVEGVDENGSAAGRGKGKGKGGRGDKRGGGRSRGKGRGSTTETPVHPTKSESHSHDADTSQPHAKQNGHAVSEVIDLAQDDNDLSTSRGSGRLTRSKLRGSNQAALLDLGTTDAYHQWAFDTRPAKRERKAREAEEVEKSVEVKTNGHLPPSTAPPPPPILLDKFIKPPSPRFDLSGDEGEGDDVQGAETILLSAYDSVTEELIEREAAVEVSDDPEDEPLAKLAAKKAAVRRSSSKRRTPFKPRSKKRAKLQTAAKKRTQKMHRQSEMVDVDDGDKAVSKQPEELHTEKPTAKQGRAVKEAAPVTSAEADGSSSSKVKGAKARRGSRVKSSNPSPPPAESPTAAIALPTSVFSVDEHPSDYHLAAVLLHKGQYANHGHYTATLRDDSGVWWSFDDRVVTRLGERFYNRGGEVVMDAKEGEQEEDKQKEAEKTEAGEGSKEEAGETTGDGGVMREEKETKPDVREQEAEVVEVVETEASQPPAKKRRGGGRREVVKEEVQVDAHVNTEAVADNQPARRRSGRPKKAAESTAAAAEVTDDKPVMPPKGAGRPKKSVAQKANADASGVDAKTKKEAERMYGPGGFSKDAYMLLYCNKHHPALTKLKDEQDAADAELHDAEQPPTFLTVASHPQLAKLLIKKYHHEEVDRENTVYQAECTAYKEKRAVIEAEMDRRKAEVEEVAAMLQAQAIEVDNDVNEELDTPLEERAEVLEQGKRTRFVSTQWLARFLTGWTEPEKEKKADAKAKKAADKHDKDERDEKDEKVEGKSDSEAAPKDGLPSPVIDVSSDDDSSADNNTTAADKPPKDEEATLEEQADAGESKGEKSEADKPKNEKEEDPGALVVDHDVHISADGMQQAMMQAINQLDPGSLTESVNSIRCPHHRDRLSPHMLTAVKRVTVEAWSRLVELDKERSRKLLQEAAKRIEAASVAGDVDMIPSSQSDEADAALPDVLSMALSDVCLECARSLFLGDLIRKRNVERVRRLLGQYHVYRGEHRNDSTPPDGSVWLSNAFIQRWKRHCQQVIASAKAAKDAAQQAELADKQRELDAVQLGDAMEGVKCEHNALSTDRTARLWVSRKLWQAITAMASVDDAEMFNVDADECPLCTQEEEQDNEEAKLHKAAMKDERAALRTWASKSHRFPDPSASPASLFNKSSTIYLLPQLFQSDVYAFLHQRDPTDPPRPRFSAALLLCEHGLLKYVPRPVEGVIGQGGVVGTRLGALVYCDEKVWAELKRYQYVDENEPGVQLQYARIVGGGGALLSEQWSSYELTPTPAVCEECVRRRQADEETGRTMFTKEDGGGIRVTTVATEEEAKSTASLFSSPTSSSSSSAASPPSALPTSVRPRRAAASRGGKQQPLAIVELNCASSDPVYQLKMELLSQSYSAAWEPARQRWYWQGQLMDDSRTLAEYGVVRGGEVKVWLGGESDWDGTDAGRMEMWSEGKKGKSAAAERGFQGTALAMHARQHVQNAASSQPAPQHATNTIPGADEPHVD